MSYSQYRSGKSIGRLLRFAYEYSHQADYWHFSDVAVFDGKGKIGTYIWVDFVHVFTDATDRVSTSVADIPVFTFGEKFHHLNGVQIEKMLDIIKIDALYLRAAPLKGNS